MDLKRSRDKIWVSEGQLATALELLRNVLEEDEYRQLGPVNAGRLHEIEQILQAELLRNAP